MTLPLEHLSASSITKFLRCPRMWQDEYIFGNRGPSNSSLIIGSAVHLTLSKILRADKRVMTFEEDWRDVIEEAQPSEYRSDVLPRDSIVWKDPPDRAYNIALKHVYDYYELVGKHLVVTETEKEIAIEVPGVPIPVIGFVDVVCPGRIIDVKTTGYFNRKPSLNPEWKLQANIYQLSDPVPCEFHVLTRSKTDPVVVPGHPEDKLFVRPPVKEDVERIVRQTYGKMLFMYETYGDEPWTGGETHEWAGRYCGVANCCQKG